MADLYLYLKSLGSAADEAARKLLSLGAAIDKTEKIVEKDVKAINTAIENVHGYGLWGAKKPSTNSPGGPIQNVTTTASPLGDLLASIQKGTGR